MYNTAHLGKIVRLHRLKKGLTLEKVSELCDLSVRGLEKIELGDSDPKWSNVVKISGVLELNLGDFSRCVSLPQSRHALFR